VQTSDNHSEDSDCHIRSLLKKLDRENLRQWWNAVVVILLLVGAMVVLSLPRMMPDDGSFLPFRPTRYVQGLLGFILIFATYTLYQQRVLSVLRKQLATQLRRVTAQQERANNLYEMAVLDPLTGLYNRRFVEERLQAEIARAERHGDALMVLLLDLDDFKQINDRFGHAAGDLVLKELAHRIRKAVRASDFAVRMGGDEFLVLLPECPPDKIKLVLSRLGPIEMEFNGTRISVSSSKGYAQFQQGETVEELIERADQELYAAKAVRRARATEAGQRGLFQN
jgi:diguanylate cyclase (GGDEF)-like protein